MQFSTIAAVALSALSVSACAPGEAGATCMTSGGSWLYMISPFANAAIVAGQPFDITWDVCGPDATFLKSDISFEIADATNPNNVLSIAAGQLTFKTQPNVANLKATTNTPTTLVAGTKYTIKSSYHDVAVNQWKSCFGNTFTVTGPAGNSSATVVPTTKSKADKISFVAASAAVAGALFL
ncbi:UNVERIFIED_CONTAM: hypothetical protein HDU68_003476 [Siphonaria sp. JEL0065]|nr:hypothetical protein HDU68_003476 [Siphonaria sp. JEL0065]